MHDFFFALISKGNDRSVTFRLMFLHELLNIHQPDSFSIGLLKHCLCDDHAFDRFQGMEGANTLLKKW